MLLRRGVMVVMLWACPRGDRRPAFPRRCCSATPSVKPLSPNGKLAWVARCKGRHAGLGAGHCKARTLYPCRDEENLSGASVLRWSQDSRTLLYPQDSRWRRTRVLCRRPVDGRGATTVPFQGIRARMLVSPRHGEILVTMNLRERTSSDHLPPSLDTGALSALNTQDQAT